MMPNLVVIGHSAKAIFLLILCQPHPWDAEHQLWGSRGLLEGFNNWWVGLVNEDAPAGPCVLAGKPPRRPLERPPQLSLGPPPSPLARLTRQLLPFSRLLFFSHFILVSFVAPVSSLCPSQRESLAQCFQRIPVLPRVVAFRWWKWKWPMNIRTSMSWVQPHLLSSYQWGTEVDIFPWFLLVS